MNSTTFQCTAETAYDMLSPGPSVRHRAIAGKSKGQRRKRNNQPIDLREGMHNAYNVVKEVIILAHYKNLILCM